MPLAVANPAWDVGRHCGLCLTWVTREGGDEGGGEVMGERDKAGSSDEITTDGVRRIEERSEGREKGEKVASEIKTFTKVKGGVRGKTRGRGPQQKSEYSVS